MQMEFVSSTEDRMRESASKWFQEDPLDSDGATDEPILTTRRGLMRIALVAAETASRFSREQSELDPMAWMLAPRRLFDGRSAIDGCLDRAGCLRAVLLHGLSIGLDADPSEVDELVADEEHCAQDAARSDRGNRGHDARLWTSFVAVHDAGGAVQAFDAVIARGRDEAEARFRARHGVRLFDDMEIREGFDASLPLAEALVSPALSDMLVQVAADPASPLAAGLSVSVMQRFVS